MYCWIAARAPAREGTDRGTIDDRISYSRFIQHELQATFPEAEGGTWADHLKKIDKHILGLAYLKPRWVPDSTTYLRSGERAIMDYWAATRFNDVPVFL